MAGQIAAHLDIPLAAVQRFVTRYAAHNRFARQSAQISHNLVDTYQP